MNGDDFTFESDHERREEIEATKADEWQDQKIDREAWERESAKDL